MERVNNGCLQFGARNSRGDVVIRDGEGNQIDVENADRAALAALLLGENVVLSRARCVSALGLAIKTIRRLVDQQAMPDDFYEKPLAQIGSVWASSGARGLEEVE